MLQILDKYKRKFVTRRNLLLVGSIIFIPGCLFVLSYFFFKLDVLDLQDRKTSSSSPDFSFIQHNGDILGVSEPSDYTSESEIGFLGEGLKERLSQDIPEVDEDKKEDDGVSLKNLTESSDTPTGGESPEQPAPPQPPPPSGCPLTRMNCVPCFPGEAYCRYEPGETTGFLGWACQNNNQSNIRYSEFRVNIIRQMGGPAPCGEKGSFMVFSTYNDGWNGTKAYLRGISAGLHFMYASCGYGECTLREFFSIYAPAADQNDPNSYSEYMAARLGIASPDSEEQDFGWCVANKLDAMVAAFEYKEGWFTDPPKYYY
ncbi:hypothetical protein JW766_04360 [Candidatus Dojkabacteria bacterium]|nr:hypothetical protein [Candidatus Dojkabacteria bacterium]